jgi:hypothetical protein
VRPASNIHHAIRLAEAIGSPLNQFVTLNFSKTTCPPEMVSEQFALLRSNRFAKWVTRPQKGGGTPCEPTFVWVIESAGGCTAVHWLVHVPPARTADFARRLPKWLADVAGEVTCESAVHIRAAYQPKGAGRYMLKGIDPNVASFFGIRDEAQGFVVGKRCGTSINVGATAKKRLRAEGAYPEARRWRPYPKASPQRGASAGAA